MVGWGLELDQDSWEKGGVGWGPELDQEDSWSSELGHEGGATGMVYHALLTIGSMEWKY